MLEQILKLIDAYWRFDESQQPKSSWHEKQDLKDAVRREFILRGKKYFDLNDTEFKSFEKSKSKSIKFEMDSGIGTAVYIKDKNGKWKDITDYKSW